MRIEMKRVLFIILSFVICISSFSQGTENPLVNQIKLIKQQQGDSIARCYLDSKKDSLIQKGEPGNYLLLLGLLTSAMWHKNPTESLKKEYREYLDAVIDNEIMSKEFTPNYELLSSLWQLTYDYYNMLYLEGDKETTLQLLLIIHRWFEPYPEARNSLGYARSLLDLCLVLVRDMHKYEEGKTHIEEYAEVAKRVYGKNSAQYAVALYNLCYIPSKTTEEKVALLKKAISIYEASEYQDSAMLSEMKTMYNSTMALITGVVNTDSINDNSNGILPINDCTALIIAERGAEALGSLNYYKDLLSQERYIDTLRYSEVISYIITAYIQINELAKAQKEIEDFHAKIGIDNIPPNYSQIFYSSAGLIAMQLKDYPKALRYCHAACKLSEQQNRYDLEYCKILGNLSTIYGKVGESDSEFYLDAKWYIDEAISVFQNQIGDLTQHGAIGLTLLNNKAWIYEALGERQESIETYEQIVKDFGDIGDVKGAWVLAANNLAMLYMKYGKPEKAVTLLESLSSKNKEHKQMFAQNIALAYYFIGDSRVKKAVQDFNSISYDNCLDVFNFFTVAEREDYWSGVARELLVLNNLIADKYPDNTDVAFNNMLFVKNLKLMSGDILKKMVDNSSSIELKSKYDKISALRDAISYRSSEKDSIKIWMNQLNEEERGILSLVPDYKMNLLKSIHSWNEIKESLKDDEIAVDFTYIPKIRNWGNSDAYGYYGAFVITKESQKPELVSLCEVDSINQYFTGAISDTQQVSMLYKESRPIYKRIWGNIEEFLKGKKTIYFSPTGQLNLLNHDALVFQDGKRFGEVYNIVRLSSIDKILTLRFPKTKAQECESAVIYGGIDYDLTVNEMTEVAKQYKHDSDINYVLAKRSDNERGHWDYLPGTKEESQSVYNILNSNSIPSLLLQDAIANEESFKALSGHSPYIIHLSTHGFFLNSQEKVKANPFMEKIGSYSEQEDKLIRTGVLMAGANNEWCGTNHVSGIEDGILTADEISRLDLSGTNLVVLAACETAKGYVDEIDGILGLQRGFKKAGANSILMSLNKVDDEATRILMVEFYRNLMNGKTKLESLQEAQQYLRKVDNGKYDDPKYWASFIMLDGLN